jgi:Pyridoxamine 5'-phosphate oxidase
MSVKVDLAELSAALDGYGFAYLMTVSDEQRAHAVAVVPVLDADAALVVGGLGRRTRANLEARPDISLVWPPTTEGGYSLILDGRATLTDDGASIAPGSAVMHRPAGTDCVTVAGS